MALIFFAIVAVIMSAIIHEFAHGWMAYQLGDETAKNAGRLTLNPIPHLDPLGSIILPLLLVFSGSPFVLGWAKPVPYNPYNLKDPEYGDLKVALAGPGSNFLLAIFFGLVARFTAPAVMLKQTLISSFFQGNFEAVLGEMSGSLLVSIFVMSMIICFVNLILMLFNLIPVPPLDGSKVLMTFLPADWQIKFQQIEPYGIFIVLFLLFVGLIDLIFIPLIFLFQV
ncbi:MAG TPA: site-2 protease family protein, partial [Patescibacteria group bacterium]|nr:site-2 protease family protein [Patescibacteria group bacterium]